MSLYLLNWSPLQNADIYRDIARKNAERVGGSTVTMYPSQSAIDAVRGGIARGTYEHARQSALAGWECDRGEAIEEYRAQVFPERYEAFT